VVILLIIQPDFLFGQSNESYSQYRYLMFFSLAAAFTSSIAKTYLHDMQGKIPGTVVLQYFYIGQCFFNSVAMMFQEEDPNALSLDWNFFLNIFLLTLSAYFTQMFSTRALLLKKPSYIMPLSYISIVLSAITDFLLFGNSFSTLSIIGMFLTSSGLLVKILIP
jgi:drug/metabolite transporter (DMT)-like permease